MRYLLPLFLSACHFDPGTPSIADAIESIPIIDAGQDEASVADVVKAPSRILLIGDSQVQYMDWYFSKSGVKRSNETVFFDSKPGTTIGYWNNGVFVQEMWKYPRMDVVIIMLGTNNWAFRGYHQNLTIIIDEIKRRKVKCLWVGGTEVYHHHHPYINDWLRNNVSPCVFFDTEATGISLLDGVHPDLNGGIKWLHLIWQAKDQ